MTKSHQKLGKERLGVLVSRFEKNCIQINDRLHWLLRAN